MSEEQKNDQGTPEAPQPPSTPQAPEAVPAPDQAAAVQQPPMGGQIPPQQPPMGQAPQPQPQPGYAPQPQPMYQPQPPAFYPPAPLMQLTGGMKFAWLVVGALLGIPGIIIAWLVNVDKMPQVKSDALKFAIIGFVIWIALGIIFSLIIGGMVTAVVAGAMGSAGMYDYSYHGSW